METVGAATWTHSLRSLRPGGTIVISGATSGPEPRRRRADPDLLPAAPGDRLDDGHPRRAGPAGVVPRRHRHQAADRPHAADDRGPRRVRRDGDGRRVRQDRVHPLMAHPPRHRRRLRHRRGRSPTALHERGDDLVLLARIDRAGRRAGRATSRARRRSSPTWPTRDAVDGARPSSSPTGSTRVLHVAGVVELGARRRARRAAAWQEQLDVNLVAPALLTRRLPAGAAGGAGHGRLRELRRRAVRRPAVVGVRRVEVRRCAPSPTRCAAEEREHGVRVDDASTPARTATPMQQKVHEQEGRDDPTTHRCVLHCGRSPDCRRRPTLLITARPPAAPNVATTAPDPGTAARPTERRVRPPRRRCQARHDHGTHRGAETSGAARDQGGPGPTRDATA